MCQELRVRSWGYAGVCKASSTQMGWVAGSGVLGWWVVGTSIRLHPQEFCLAGHYGTY